MGVAAAPRADGGGGRGRSRSAGTVDGQYPPAVGGRAPLASAHACPGPGPGGLLPRRSHPRGPAGSAASIRRLLGLRRSRGPTTRPCLRCPPLLRARSPPGLGAPAARACGEERPPRSPGSRIFEGRPPRGRDFRAAAAPGPSALRTAPPGITRSWVRPLSIPLLTLVSRIQI